MKPQGRVPMQGNRGSEHWVGANILPRIDNKVSGTEVSFEERIS